MLCHCTLSISYPLIQSHSGIRSTPNSLAVLSDGLLRVANSYWVRLRSPPLLAWVPPTRGESVEADWLAGPRNGCVLTGSDSRSCESRTNIRNSLAGAMSYGHFPGGSRVRGTICGDSTYESARNRLVNESGISCHFDK